LPILPSFLTASKELFKFPYSCQKTDKERIMVRTGVSAHYKITEAESNPIDTMITLYLKEFQRSLTREV
jgi:hypothetical protein